VDETERTTRLERLAVLLVESGTSCEGQDRRVSEATMHISYPRAADRVPFCIYMFASSRSFVDIHYFDISVPMKRLGTIDEVVKSVAYLLSDDSSYTTGTNLVIDGGLSSGLKA
jgi:NAD(P)-dependent dehydrogenase (short-subunit alcohol dehydrogenase family)